MNARELQRLPQGGARLSAERESQTYNASADGHPAKLWELLRRNPEFRGTAKRILTLARSKSGGKRLQAKNALSELRRSHPCAATAILWLCPHPTFQLTLKQRVDGTDLEGNPTKFDVQWVGFEPKPPPLIHPAWRVLDGRPHCGGHPVRIGPTLWQIEGDPVDSFRQWREDEKNLPRFTLACAWPQTPHLFRSAIAYDWRHIEHGVSPHTGQPDPFLSLCETNFFQGWRLADFDRSTREGLVRQMEFDRLSEYRVFAIPKLRYATAREIDDLLKRLGERLKADLVCKGEILGTETQWKVLLSVEADRVDCYEQRLSFSLEDALTRAGRELYGAKYDPQHRKEIVLGYFKAMDSQGANPGWIQKVFPVLPPEILEPNPQSAA